MATRLKRAVTTAGAKLGDLLCPPLCVACEVSIRRADRGLCPRCRAEVACFEDFPCRRCGAPTVLEQPNLAESPIPCAQCHPHSFRFDEVITAGVYRGMLREMALRSKRLSHEPAAAALGMLVSERAAARLRRLEVDVVTSVPMHWRRRLGRQTNGPELIAKVVADRFGFDFAPQLLRKIRPTVPQPSVARSGRLANQRRAFRLAPGFRLHGATVLLVDDILTSGATCSEAAGELKRAGAKRVVAVVAARAI